MHIAVRPCFDEERRVNFVWRDQLVRKIPGSFNSLSIPDHSTLVKIIISPISKSIGMSRRRRPISASGLASHHVGGS